MHVSSPAGEAKFWLSRNSRPGRSVSAFGSQISCPSNGKYGSPLSKSSRIFRLTRNLCSGVTVTYPASNKSQQPVFVKAKGEDEAFYVRTGPSSTKMSASEQAGYISSRFA